MKALALNRIERRGADGEPEVVSAKSVFDCSKEDFQRLEALGAARKASKDEIALAKEAAESKGNVLTDADEDDETEVDTAAASASAPASGAAGDPQGKPKGAKAKAAAGGDLDV